MGILKKLFGGGRAAASVCRCTAVILAAGSAERFGENKMFVELWDKPVLAHSLIAFEDCSSVSEIIVVTREADITQVAELCRFHNITKATKVLVGGATRQKSSLIGINAVSPDADIIAIHDGARPLVTPEIIDETISAAVLYKAAVPGVPLKDTVKVCSGDVVKQTLDRNALRAVQTPQTFCCPLIKGALTAAENADKQYTDDCSAAEAFGMEVHITLGDDENIKITTPFDLIVANAIMDRRCRS